MRRHLASALLICVLGATCLVYRGLTGVYFEGDDFIHLFAIVDADLNEYLLRPHGGHLLLVRNAVFVAFHALFGMRSELYYACVLATHLLNTFLFFRIVHNWSASATVAALTALLWGVCPSHAGTLGWYSVYGQALVGTILLLILLPISRRDRVDGQLSPLVLASWPLMLIIASFCFGVGIGLTMAAPLAILLLLPPSRGRRVIVGVLALLAAITPQVYQALILYHDRLVGSVADGWTMGISLARLKTPGTIFSMLGYLLSCGVSDLLLNFAWTRAQFPSNASTAATAGYALVVASAFVWAPAPVRRRMITLLILACAIYGIIAAGRAAYAPAARADLIASALVLRYHYAGTIPLCLLLAVALAQLTARTRYADRIRSALLGATAVFLLVFYVRAPVVIDTNPFARSETMQALELFRTAIAARPAGSEVRILNKRFGASGYMRPSFKTFPGYAAVFTLFNPSNVVAGRRVRFEVENYAAINDFPTGKRARDLLVLNRFPRGPGARRFRPTKREPLMVTDEQRSGRQ